jgi:hypothetical protein
MAMAGGVTLSVCVPPVIVVAEVEKHGELAFGQTCKIHFEPIGEMVALSGTLCEYAPVPPVVPGMTLLSAPPVHVYGPVGKLGLGTNWNWYLALFHVCAPASVTWPLTVVDWPKALADPTSRKARARMGFFMDELLCNKRYRT